MYSAYCKGGKKQRVFESRVMRRIFELKRRLWKRV
jgi:hypothetical protein